jgi:hypothetical protein
MAKKTKVSKSLTYIILVVLALGLGGTVAGVKTGVIGGSSSGSSSQVAGGSNSTSSGTSTAGMIGSAGDESTGSSQLATDVLDTLAVKGKAPMTGYAREQFGPDWADVDHNGCDTRNDILHRDLTDITTKAGTHDCTVLTGVFNDPYTGKTIDFTRGTTTSQAVQIDHVVPLGNAWATGAQQLSSDQRKALANDPYELLAADGPTNGAKGDGDAATWLPPNKAFRCDYVARQIGVKKKYSLWVTSAEKSAMQRVLASCPTQVVP